MSEMDVDKKQEDPLHIDVRNLTFGYPGREVNSTLYYDVTSLTFYDS